jgi:two-component SAPR family response regulator
MILFRNTQRRVVFLFLALSSVFGLYAGLHENGKYEKGLYFRSNEVEKNSRTSLILTPDKSIRSEEGFSMSFGIKLRSSVKHNYGYIFRIIANDSLNIDLISMDIVPGEDLFSLVVANKSVIRFNLNEFEAGDTEDWMDIRFSIDPQEHQLIIRINGIEKQYDYNPAGLQDFNIFFGAGNHHLFTTTDVSMMTVRDIRIYDNDRLIRSWELGKHGYNAVYDSCIQAKAIVKNPVWEVDAHINWKKKASFLFPFIDPQIAFDDESGRIFFAQDQYVFVYNVIAETLDTVSVKEGMPYDTRANQMIYDKNKKELVSYNFESNELNRFNFEKREWKHFTDYIPPRRWHHSKIFIPEENILLTVGGYGFHQYRKDIFIYSVQEKKWKNFQGDSTVLTPRYLGGLGYMGEGSFLYFGGLGNISGNQDELPKNYYDLFRINIKDDRIEKLWTLTDIEEHFVNGNSLIIDKRQNAFFTLTYPDKLFLTTIRLCKFNIDTGEYQFAGDSISFQFNDNESYCDLFYLKSEEKLIAVTAHSGESNACEINVFSINYPPLNLDDVLQKETVSSSSVNRIYIFLIFFILISGSLFILLTVKKERCFYLKKRYIIQEKKDNEQAVDKKVINAPVRQKSMPKSSIILLGELQITDNKGSNITNSFTPILGQIFLLSLLYTIKNGTGITTSKLIETIWGQEDDKKIRNNLYVNVNKLRSIIKMIDHVELVSNERTWGIILGDDVFCDYKNVMALIDIIDVKEVISKDLLNELLELASKGNLLPNLPWASLDGFKSEYTNFLIDKLSLLMEQKDVKEDLPLLLKIANAILICDNIDENALQKKCYALYHLGKKRQTIECFEKFKKDYKSLLGTEYKSTLDKFIG